MSHHGDTKFSPAPQRLRRKGGKLSPRWYGRRRDPGGKWTWVPLLENRRESERLWERLKLESEQVASGAVTPAELRLRDTPIATLADEYRDALRDRGNTADSVRVADWTVRRLIELGNWSRFADVTRESMAAILRKLEAAGKTASYRNGFVKRAKAFVAFHLPDGKPDPLKHLRRAGERDAKKTRERRAATAEQLSALFALGGRHRVRGAEPMPLANRLAYALAAYNGLRRNEAARLTWADVRTDLPVPCLSVRRKGGATPVRDLVPVHPFVLELLEEMRCSREGYTESNLSPVRSAAAIACLSSTPTNPPNAPASSATISPADAPNAAKDGKSQTSVLPRVPDVQTLRRQWTRAGVAFRDEQGRRLDYHALRHTFATRLEMAGVSRATVKALMRHSRQGVTEGYIHAEMREMREAIVRLQVPVAGLGSGAREEPGTPAEQTALTPAEPARTRRGHGASPYTLNSALLSGADTSLTSGCYSFVSAGLRMDVPLASAVALTAGENRVIVLKSGPSTQVGYFPGHYSSGIAALLQTRGHGADTAQKRRQPKRQPRVRSLYAPGVRRYVRVCGRLIPRVPRPLPTPPSAALRRTVARLLPNAAAAGEGAR